VPVAIANLNVDQYASYSQGFVYLMNDGVTPVNLTGYTAAMMAKQNPSQQSSYALINITDKLNSQGQILLGLLTGLVTINLLATTTSALTPYMTLVYDLFLIAPGGQVIDFLKGNIFTAPGVIH
jgi:hypothetical protein